MPDPPADRSTAHHDPDSTPDHRVSISPDYPPATTPPDLANLKRLRRAFNQSRADRATAFPQAPRGSLRASGDDGLPTSASLEEPSLSSLQWNRLDDDRTTAAGSVDVVKRLATDGSVSQHGKADRYAAILKKRAKLDREFIRPGMPVEEPPWYFVYPTGKFRRAWDAYILCLLLYISTIQIWRISFLGVPGTNSFYFWWNRIMDISFTVDIVLNFLTGYITRSGYLEQRFDRISKKYLTSWFLIDLISVIPWDLVVLGTEGRFSDTASPSWIELPRLLRLFRVLRVFQFSRNILLQEWFTRLEVRLRLKYGHLRLYMFFAFSVLVAHWTACLFYFFAVIQSEDTNTWIKEYTDFASNDFENYVGALYFSVYTITTIGYGDVTPVSTAERVYTVFMMMLGAAIWAFILSAVASLISELAVNEIHYRTLMDQLAEYSKERSLSKDLTTSIRRFIHHRREHHRFVNEEFLMDSMSAEQRAQLMRQTFMGHIEKSYLLRGISEELVTLACASMERHSFAPGEHVFRIGKPPEGLAVITHGHANLTDKDGRVVCALAPGDIFGEEELLFNRPRQLNCVAVKFLDIAVLSREDVLELLQSAPEKLAEVTQYEALRSWKTTLSFVVEQARADKVVEALAAGAGIHLKGLPVRRRSGDEPSSNGDITLHCAQGNLSAVVRALAAGADARQMDYDRRTPLHLAASEGHTEVVKVLLEHGADATVRDRWGNTPVDDARRDGHVDVLDVFGVGHGDRVGGGVHAGHEDARSEVSASTVDYHTAEDVLILRGEVKKRDKYIGRLETEIDGLRAELQGIAGSMERLTLGSSSRRRRRRTDAGMGSAAASLRRSPELSWTPSDAAGVGMDQVILSSQASRLSLDVGAVPDVDAPHAGPQASPDGVDQNGPSAP